MAAGNLTAISNHPLLRRLVWLLIAAAFAAAVWLVWTPRGQPAAEPRRSAAEQPVPVVVAAARESDDGMVVEAVGTGLARRSATLQPAVSGEVASVAFKAGDRVRAGQVLMRLVDRRQQLDARLAAARVDATIVTLRRSRGR